MKTTQVVVERGAFQRPEVRGKFLYVGEKKFWVKGVSYGTFAMDENGNEKLTPETVEKDFARMAENGFNVVRTYTTPPRWFLDAALRHGLRVMVGAMWEQQTAFLEERGAARKIEEIVRAQVRSCSGHPAVLCYIVANEIPASVVRWYGKGRIERFLKRLYSAAKQVDPGALVTYANYPSTEYLRLPFLDLVCFNVYLESQRPFEDYLARLHSLSDERPVLMTELGLDSRRNGLEKQAETLDWQLRTVFRSGCCGCVVYSWTDEWHLRFGPVEDWDFGLTTRSREPKPALEAVKRAFAEMPFPASVQWPKVTVVVCTFNGEKRIRETLEGLAKLDYPDFEGVVVDDGSTDSTAKIVAEYSFRLIRTENHGLASARNTGIRASSGEIVAFIDDDAYPDPHWLKNLVSCLTEGRYSGAGGPNFTPLGEGWTGSMIGRAPRPRAVLHSDVLAEHVPGCNMAFWKKVLEGIGGFDPVFRAAGDDVDLCWRLSETGGQIGYSHSAVVWHHPRNSIRSYWRQQAGYGRAEALLERKWPRKYDPVGRTKWSGRIYGTGYSLGLTSLRSRVYHGVWGTAPFQSLYRSASPWSLFLTPEWYFVVGAAAIATLLSIGWAPVAFFVGLLLLTLSLPVTEAMLIGAREGSDGRTRGLDRVGSAITVAFLYLMEPLARLSGRLRSGMTPWRRHGKKVSARYHPLTMKRWRGEWSAVEATLKDIQTSLWNRGAVAVAGGEFDDWDLEVRGGTLGMARLLLAIEEHGAGIQLLRFRIWPRYPLALPYLGVPLAFMAAAAWLGGAWAPALAACLLDGVLAFRAVTDAGFACGTIRDVLKDDGAK